MPLAVENGLANATLVLVLTSVLALWVHRVNKVVSEPYLDELFHVRQAQAYCEGRFSQWDPKITTPPGLYLASWLLAKASLLDCDLAGLRFVNLLGLCLISLLCWRLFSLRRSSSSKLILVDFVKQRVTSLTTHAAFNACLFPPLFFFSALYYTDIFSTVSVLLNSWLHGEPRLSRTPLLRSVLLVLTGVVSLFFRQTNVFWVGVFPAILDLVRTVRPNDKAPNRRPSWHDLISGRSIGQFAFDLPLADVNLEDCLKIPISITIAAVVRWRSVLTAVAPYCAIVAVFASFIIWNGGVVLGDKSNHIATLHLPQMLYVWPLITFFSWPLFVPHVLASVLPPTTVPNWLLAYRPKTPISKYDYRSNLLIRGALIGSIIGLTFFIIRYNTIVHPFTLADNRHYMFYVFRILVLRHPYARYLAAPVYIACGWAVLQAFCKPSDKRGTSDKLGELEPDTTMGSYVLAWSATTTLTLVSAPLVEPRYFILPWLFWRLAVPSPGFTGQVKRTQAKQKDNETVVKKETPKLGNKTSRWWHILDHGDGRLWFETAWLLLINAVTGYVFLYNGFEWPQEPGNIQRFMW